MSFDNHTTDIEAAVRLDVGTVHILKRVLSH